MDIVRLIRQDQSDQGTFGVLLAKGKKFYTGELPWHENKPNISCIPTGRYRAYWDYSPRFKRKLYGVVPVSKRAGIRVHSANLMGDKQLGFLCQLNGCIALGYKLGFIDGQKAILLSAPAIREFQSLMEYKTFEMVITNGTINL
jgi:hypothetical protein